MIVAEAVERVYKFTYFGSVLSKRFAECQTPSYVRTAETCLVISEPFGSSKG